MSCRSACLPALLAVALLTSCFTPSQGRTWRLLDTQTRYLSTSMQLVADGDQASPGKQIASEYGCLVVQGTVSAVDNVEQIRIYEAEDWSRGGTGGQSSTKFLISDPPRQSYPGVTDREAPTSVPSTIRKPAGMQVAELPADRYPFRLEWQVVAGEGREWIADPKDMNLLLERSFEVRNDAAKRFRISLCDVELRKLLAVPVQEFAVLFRLTPIEWPAGGKQCPVKVVYLRERITRALIEQQLR